MPFLNMLDNTWCFLLGKLNISSFSPDLRLRLQKNSNSSKLTGTISNQGMSEIHSCMYSQFHRTEIKKYIYIKIEGPPDGF